MRYDIISAAIDGYMERDYKYIDTPWLVDEYIAKATIDDPNVEPFRLDPKIERGHIVGSAEQGFLQLMYDNKLSAGKYVSAGPCFRNEPVLDAHHQRTFFKVELCDYLGVSSDLKSHEILDLVYKVAQSATLVLSDLAPRCDLVAQSTDKFSIDLMVNGVEVGSYGFRNELGHMWVYGTGLALPRFDRVITDYLYR